MAAKKPDGGGLEVKEAPVVRRPSPAESSDPAVHQLLSHRQSAQLNDDADELARIDAQLADLGY